MVVMLEIFSTPAFVRAACGGNKRWALLRSAFAPPQAARIMIRSQNGHTMGTTIMAITPTTMVMGIPILTKSVNLYPPGPYTIILVW